MNRLAETWAHQAGSSGSADLGQKGWGCNIVGKQTGFHGGSAYDVRVLNGSASLIWAYYDPAFGGAPGNVPIPMSSKVTWGWHITAPAVNYGGTSIMAALATNLTPIVGITLAADGTISAYRGGTLVNLTAGTLLGSSAAGAWWLVGSGAHMVEMQVYRHASAGTVEVRVDAVTVLNLSGLDTSTGTGSDIAACQWIGNIDYTQDHYVNDDTGSAPTGFVGDIRNELLVPTGDGHYSDWTPVPGGTHYTTVDDQPVSFSGYVKSSVAGNKDSYTMSSLDTVSASAIPVVRISAQGLKRETSTRGFSTFVRSNSVDSALGTETRLINPINTISVAESAHSADPSGGGAWTIARVNAIEACVDLTT